LGIALSLVGASAALWPVIDDFEAGGPFIFSCSTVAICSDYENIGSHGLDDVRLTYIHGNGSDLVSASLVNTPYDDALSVWGVDAFLGLHWDPPGIVDITDGPWSSIHIRMDAQAERPARSACTTTKSTATKPPSGGIRRLR
jgi:hypothetical protein